jgi:Methyltransferase domain
MSDAWTDRWNKRFSNAEFVYGELPNDYFREQIGKLPVGKILLPAEGEGRNGVYAARMGWQVSAFDISVEGNAKATKLAEKNNVTLDYQVGELHTLNYPPGQFDALALIYAHFPAAIKSNMHKALSEYVRKGGVVIFEAFSKNHLQYNSNNETVGGPKEIGMLFSTEELLADFPEYEVIELEEKVIELNEGSFHSGTGSVIRFVGRKK